MGKVVFLGSLAAEARIDGRPDSLEVTVEDSQCAMPHPGDLPRAARITSSLCRSSSASERATHTSRKGVRSICWCSRRRDFMSACNLCFQRFAPLAAALLPQAEVCDAPMSRVASSSIRWHTIVATRGARELPELDEVGVIRCEGQVHEGGPLAQPVPAAGGGQPLPHVEGCGVDRVCGDQAVDRRDVLGLRPDESQRGRAPLRPPLGGAGFE